MFLENQAFLESKVVDERISRAIDNDHTAAMRAPGDSKKIKKKNGAPEMLYMCVICNKVFKNQCIYLKHLKGHTNDKTVHQCPQCGKVLMSKLHLQTHMQTHAKYQCLTCHKRFNKKGNLNQHMLLHPSKKTFKCTICDKDFSQQEHLKAHVRDHNNERPFECELCFKSFNIKSSLQRHMNCHTGAKPFICDICNRGYTRRSVLMLHIQQVHENKKPFQCEECQLCFSQKGNLQAHYKRKHMQPKSDGKRGKDKDGKLKKGVKRQHPKSKPIKPIPSKNFSTHSKSEDPTIKPRIDNTSLHSYASKVKAIVSRGASRASQQAYSPLENQRVVNKVSISKSTAPLCGVVIKQEDQTDQSATYSSPSSVDSSSGSSDEAIDVGGCSSSSEDIPEYYFPDVLNSIPTDPSYDLKTLSELESPLIDMTREWGEFLLGESEETLTSLHYSCDVNSPSKSLRGSAYKSTDEILTWAEDDGTTGLFADLDTDYSSMCGLKI